MPCPYSWRQAIGALRACFPHVLENMPAVAAFWRRRVNPQYLFIREMHSGAGFRASRTPRRRRSCRSLRCIEPGPIQFNLRSNAHRLLLFISVLSGSSVLKSENRNTENTKNHGEPQRNPNSRLSPCLAVLAYPIWVRARDSSSYTPIRSRANALRHVRGRWQILLDFQYAQFGRHPNSPSAGIPRAPQHDRRTTSRREQTVTGGRCQVSGCRCEVLGSVGCPILRGFREGWGFCYPLRPVPCHLKPVPQSAPNATASQSREAACCANLLRARRDRTIPERSSRSRYLRDRRALAE